MYTKPVAEIIKWHNIKYHCYTNDTRIYMILMPCDKWNNIQSSIELNEDNAEFIVFWSKQHVKKIENLCIKAGSSCINYSISVKI